MTEDTQLTALQAADILAVSPAFVTKLLEDGVIQHRMDGNHRLIHIDDLLAYKAKVDQERDAVLDELAATTEAPPAFGRTKALFGADGKGTRDEYDLDLERQSSTTGSTTNFSDQAVVT